MQPRPWRTQMTTKSNNKHTGERSSLVSTRESARTLSHATWLAVPPAAGPVSRTLSAARGQQ
eukprot:681498-Lingulodinium_polyedra.AAC.1